MRYTNATPYIVLAMATSLTTIVASPVYISSRDLTGATPSTLARRDPTNEVLGYPKECAAIFQQPPKCLEALAQGKPPGDRPTDCDEDLEDQQDSCISKLLRMKNEFAEIQRELRDTREKVNRVEVLKSELSQWKPFAEYLKFQKTLNNADITIQEHLKFDYKVVSKLGSAAKIENGKILLKVAESIENEFMQIIYAQEQWGMPASTTTTGDPFGLKDNIYLSLEEDSSRIVDLLKMVYEYVGANYAERKSKNQEPANKQPENKQPENKQPENKQPENKQPENKQPENKQPENKEPKNKEPVDFKSSNSVLQAPKNNEAVDLKSGKVVSTASQNAWRKGPDVLKRPENEPVDLKSGDVIIVS